jgi:hypothetical protein
MFKPRGRTVQLPRVQGTIERRLLINYRVDPGVAAAKLPAPFRPQLVEGHAIAGICLIRLGSLRPFGFPGWSGLRSENAAHRIAVEWDAADGVRTGVYIPRRDTDALANAVFGGRIYPGKHHRARFSVQESADELSVAYTSNDGAAAVSVRVAVTEELEGSRLFSDVEAASRFFEQGSVGFSATRDDCRHDGLALQTSAWSIEAAAVRSAQSSYFDDSSVFPVGSAQLDCALVMRNVPVTWQPLPPLRSSAAA